MDERVDSINCIHIEVLAIFSQIMLEQKYGQNLRYEYGLTNDMLG